VLLLIWRQLVRTKSIDAFFEQSAREDRALRRALGAGDLVLLGVGAIIGSGIFTTIGTACAGDGSRPGAGPALTLSFLLTAAVCALTALCYAEFASMVPAAGSAYTYAYTTLGELVAWVIGWDLILEYAIGNTAVAISWSAYADGLLRGLHLDLPRWLVTDYRTAARFPEVLATAPHVLGVPIVFNALAFAIVAGITAVLVWGVRESARFNAVMVGTKVIALAFFVIVCSRFVRPGNWHPFAPNGWSGIAAGAAVVFFAYIGFDAVSTCAEECRDPGRDMPKGILGALAICTIAYMVISAVFCGLVPYSRLVQLDPTERAEALTVSMRFVQMPDWAIGVVALGSVVAQAAVLLVFQLGQARILLAMARDGLLPPAFALVHPRFRTPHVATMITGAVVGTVSAFANIDEMVDLTNIGTLFAFVLVCAAVTILRVREPARARPFRVPFGPWLVPGAGGLSCVLLIAYLPRASWLRFALWLVAGLAIYATYGFRRSRLGPSPDRSPG
jgi:APA family basic amino acid/polyamine antiporter